MSEVPAAIIDALREAARAEREQASYYRALASWADAESADLAERLNGLVADEQHHLSRLVARLLELGAPTSVGAPASPPVRTAGWETDARGRERGEIERYEALLELDLDARTRSMIETFLAAERRHEAELGGKWMAAREDGC